jgi:hypothetical protein
VNGLVLSCEIFERFVCNLFGKFFSSFKKFIFCQNQDLMVQKFYGKKFYFKSIGDNLMIDTFFILRDISKKVIFFAFFRQVKVSDHKSADHHSN